MERINIAELLKDCPKGMELNYIVYDECTLDSILEDELYPIKIRTPEGAMLLTKYGSLSYDKRAKCVIFPKGKTTWEGFHRPFKDGDILINDRGSIFIYKGPMYYNKNLADFYCGYRSTDRAFIFKQFKDKHFGDINECRFATEDEKLEFFQTIKDNGYKWNSKIKTLEKLIEPKFKPGDKIRSKNKKDECFYILNIDNDKYKYILNIKGYCLEFKDQDNYELIPDKLVELKFKVGDKVRYKNNHNGVFTITSIGKDTYVCGSAIAFWFDDQDKFELIPNKFDITTLKPFDKVLVRCSTLEKWRIQLFEKYDETYQSPFICLGSTKYNQCVPYKGNEYLLNTTDDCNNFYKT